MATKAKAPAAEDFPGFSEEGLQFLKKLSKNNNRDWFLPRKPLYEEQLQKPMAKLMFALAREMARNRIPLATNPKGALFRIYRDIRFSADKTPYKTHVGGALYPNGKKNASGVLYVHIAEKEQFAAAGFYQPDRPLLTSWRLRMQEEPKVFLNMIKQLKNKKLELSKTDTLQRVPRGFTAMEGSPIADYLRLQSLVVAHPLSRADVMSPELPAIISRFALDARPLLEYGWASSVTQKK